MRKIRQALTLPFRIVLWPFAMLWRWVGSVGSSTLGLLSEDPEDIPVSDTLIKAVSEPTLLLPHIAALRTHIFRATIALVITTAFAFTFAEDILNYLARPVGGIEALQSVGVTENISVFMRVSLLSGFTLALPYIVLEILLFIAPGLHRSERRMGCIAVPLITFLFAGGMAFAIFVALEPALDFLTNFIFPTIVRPAEYYPFVTSLMFWTGAVFEIPILIYFITAMGFVRAEVLYQSSRYIIVGLAVLAAAITPTTDPVNMLIILVPLIVLYFIGVGLAFIAQRSRDARRA